MKTLTVFSDGASRGNPGRGGWGAIVSDGSIVAELGGREENTTNNRMELAGVIAAFGYIRGNKEKEEVAVKIHTDSAYVINGATKWLAGWQKNDWRTKTKKPVKNEDLWKKIGEHINAVGSRSIEWIRVSGHSGIPANERVDRIATSFADEDLIVLFSDTIKKYSIDLTDIRVSKEKVYKKSSSKREAYSYVSSVGGKIQIHKTWAECEARVKGVSGARFKKAASPYEEKEIVRSFSNQ